MPYKSEAQRRFFNSPAGKKKLGEEEVKHWNEVSEGADLPERADDMKNLDGAIKACRMADAMTEDFAVIVNQFKTKIANAERISDFDERENAQRDAEKEAQAKINKLENKYAESAAEASRSVADLAEKALKKTRVESRNAR